MLLKNGTWYKKVRGTKRYVVQKGTLQNDKVTKWYPLQNGMCYKTETVTKWHILQNGTCYKTVHVTKWYM